MRLASACLIECRFCCLQDVTVYLRRTDLALAAFVLGSAPATVLVRAREGPASPRDASTSCSSRFLSFLASVSERASSSSFCLASTSC